MQVHYNLLEGDKPERAKLVLHTVPASTHLTPLRLDLLPRRPTSRARRDHGPAVQPGRLARRRGPALRPGAVQFDNFLAAVCGRNPADPPAATPRRARGRSQPGTIVRLDGAHAPARAGHEVRARSRARPPKTLLNVTNYNFDYQRSYDIAPITTKPGDTIQVTCTYNPTLRQQLPSCASSRPAT